MVMFFYLAGVSAGVCMFLTLAGIALLFLSVMIPSLLHDVGDHYVFKKGHILIPASIAVVLFLLATLIPSKETMYTMAAAYGVQEAVQNKDVQRIAGKSLSVIENELDKYLAKDK